MRYVSLACEIEYPTDIQAHPQSSNFVFFKLTIAAPPQALRYFRYLGVLLFQCPYSVSNLVSIIIIVRMSSRVAVSKASRHNKNRNDLGTLAAFMIALPLLAIGKETLANLFLNRVSQPVYSNFMFDFQSKLFVIVM
jgi:hypothetical protein